MSETKRKQLSRNERPHERPYLQSFRTKLRKQLTPAEATLWKALQRSKLDGRKFRRQHSVGNYILDFYCPAERLAVELDGQVHRNERAELYDYERKLFLQYYGIKVIRFENFLVFDEFDYVCDAIKSNFGWWKNEDLARATTRQPRQKASGLPPLPNKEGSQSRGLPPRQSRQKASGLPPLLNKEGSFLEQILA